MFVVLRCQLFFLFAVLLLFFFYAASFAKRVAKISGHFNMNGSRWAVVFNNSVYQFSGLIQRTINHRIADVVFIWRRNLACFNSCLLWSVMLVASLFCSLIVT